MNSYSLPFKSILTLPDFMNLKVSNIDLSWHAMHIAIKRIFNEELTRPWCQAFAGPELVHLALLGSLCSDCVHCSSELDYELGGFDMLLWFLRLNTCGKSREERAGKGLVDPSPDCRPCSG